MLQEHGWLPRLFRNRQSWSGRARVDSSFRTREGGRLWAAACFPAFSIAQELLRTSLGRTLGCLSVEPPPFSLRLTLWAAVVGSALGLGWGSGRPVL